MLYALNGDDIELIGEDHHVRLIGLKFYNSNNKREFVQELSDKVNDGQLLDGRIDIF